MIFELQHTNISENNYWSLFLIWSEVLPRKKKLVKHPFQAHYEK